MSVAADQIISSLGISSERGWQQFPTDSSLIFRANKTQPVTLDESGGYGMKDLVK